MAVRDIQAWNIKLLDITNTPISGKGIATEVELPEISREFDQDIRAGESGVINRPKYFKEMESTIKFMSMSEEFFKAIAENVAKPITLSLTASAADTITGATVPYSVNMRGYYGTLPLGSFSEDGMEGEISLMVNYISLNFGSNTLVVDPANYIYAVNGVNMFESIKAELGI